MPGIRSFSEGEHGDAAFLIAAGSVEVSLAEDIGARVVATFGAGDVFGEMCLVEPGPRSATVKALADTECVVISYDEFIAFDQINPGHSPELMKALVRRLRHERIARMNPGTRQQIQQLLHVILAGLDERDTLSGTDVKVLQRELRMLLQAEDLQIATAEVDKAEQVLRYMLRPSMEECLNLWFGKSEQTDQEIWEPFRRRRRSRFQGALRSLGPECRSPPPAGGSGDHARSIHPQHVPRHASNVRLRRALPDFGEAARCVSG